MGIALTDLTKDIQTAQNANGNDLNNDSVFNPNAEPTDAEIASLATTIQNDPQLLTELEEELDEQNSADANDAGTIDNPTLEDEKEILGQADEDVDDEDDDSDPLI